MKIFEEKGIVTILLKLLDLSESNSEPITMYALGKLVRLSRQTVESKVDTLKNLKFVEVKEKNFLSAKKSVPQKKIYIELTKEGINVSKKLREITDLLKK